MKRRRIHDEVEYLFCNKTARGEKIWHWRVEASEDEEKHPRREAMTRQQEQLEKKEEKKIVVNDNVQPWALLGPWMCLRRILILPRTICSTQRVNYSQSGWRENPTVQQRRRYVASTSIMYFEEEGISQESAQRVEIRSKSRFDACFRLNLFRWTVWGNILPGVWLFLRGP